MTHHDAKTGEVSDATPKSENPKREAPRHHDYAAAAKKKPKKSDDGS